MLFTCWLNLVVGFSGDHALHEDYLNKNLKRQLACACMPVVTMIRDFLNNLNSDLGTLRIQ